MASLPNHAGCLIAPWSSWETTATLSWTCSTAAKPCASSLPIAKLRLDAALYAPAPPRPPGQTGRPALKALLDQADVPWTVAAVAWYDGATRTVELTSQTAVWYRTSKPAVPVRWVLVRDPQGAFGPQALLCTDPAVDATQILQWFVLRWSA